MTGQEKIIEAIQQQKLLPLFYHPDAETCVGVVRALYEAGIRAVEFTNRGEHALTNFKFLVAAKEHMPGMLLGVGTIRSAASAHAFLEAGADFLISPMFDSEVADAAYLQKILYIPGCMTPTEIHEAEKAGCTLVKLFPGNVLGPGFMRSIKSLFPGVLFMPTGGVDEKNMEDWFRAGVCAVGMGSNLLTDKILEEKKFGRLQKDTEKLLKQIQSL